VTHCCSAPSLYSVTHRVLLSTCCSGLNPSWWLLALLTLPSVCCCRWKRAFWDDSGAPVRCYLLPHPISLWGRRFTCFSFPSLCCFHTFFTSRRRCACWWHLGRASSWNVSLVLLSRGALRYKPPRADGGVYKRVTLCTSHCCWTNCLRHLLYPSAATRFVVCLPRRYVSHTMARGGALRAFVAWTRRAATGFPSSFSVFL